MPRGTATTARKAATPRKAAAAKKGAKAIVEAKNAAAEALAKLTVEEQKAVAKAIMEFPEGCDDGKRRFIQKVKLPVPPVSISITVVMEVAAEHDDLSPAGRYGGSYQSMKPAKQKEHEAKIVAALTAAGFKVDEQSIDFDEVYTGG